MCDPEWKQVAIENIQSSVKGFVKITKRCQQILVDIVLSDVLAAVKVLHCDQWYEQDVMRLVVGTFEDYGEDFKKYMSEYLVSLAPRHKLTATLEV